MIEHLDGIHETVTYKENSSLRLFVNTDCEDYPIHWHTPMEIIMPLEGTYTVFLGDKPVLLQEGDIIFICPGILHSLVAPENGKRIPRSQFHPRADFPGSHSYSSDRS